MKGLSFPVMKKAYEGRPLTEEETTALTALFKDAATRQQQQSSHPYPLAGLAFFALLFVAAIVYHRRIN